MAAPISGPFTKTQDFFEGFNVIGMPGFNYPSQTRRSKWFRQAKPYKEPLPYEVDLTRVVSLWTLYPPNYRGPQWAPWYDSGLETVVVNKLHQALIDDIGSISQWANNAIEARKSVTLLAEPLEKLVRFSRAVRRKDFRGAARSLNVGLSPKLLRDLRSNAKAVGQNWLKFHFGWAPLLDDIHNGLKALTADLGTRRVRGKAREVSHWSYTSKGDYGSYYIETVDTVMRGRAACEVRISNPNLFLLNQLGLVNPASIAWEAVPFSFVVDWFVNVGDFLSSYTDLLGVEVIRPYYTITQQSSSSDRSWGAVEQSDGSRPILQYFEAHYQSFYLRRRLGFPQTVLMARPIKGPSVTRAATAVSLLLQFLK